ncbi:unnamed protein product [Pleuronectes platessa]|uniref:Uncharacterized protein n=1 Tax=Pleuronectes platessa TaxID=8262 RepID=A0A9N7YI50_PLEPL|nr:unnamed protein product [Pleuronectes platessa]
MNYRNQMRRGEGRGGTRESKRLKEKILEEFSAVNSLGALGVLVEYCTFLWQVRLRSDTHAKSLKPNEVPAEELLQTRLVINPPDLLVVNPAGDHLLCSHFAFSWSRNCRAPHSDICFHTCTSSREKTEELRSSVLV